MSDHKITLAYINVRQSIALLLTKLIVTDIILAFVVISFYFLLVQAELLNQFASHSTMLFLLVFSFIGLIKICLSIYIILQWFNEYYEITPESIIHRRGILSKRTERYDLGKVRAITVHASILGEMWDFATVTLYDIRLHKYLDLYLIHNPHRYAKIISTLKPNLELQTHKYIFPLTHKHEELIEKDED